MGDRNRAGTARKYREIRPNLMKLENKKDFSLFRESFGELLQFLNQTRLHTKASSKKVSEELRLLEMERDDILTRRQISEAYTRLVQKADGDLGKQMAPRPPFLIVGNWGDPDSESEEEEEEDYWVNVREALLSGSSPVKGKDLLEEILRGKNKGGVGDDSDSDSDEEAHKLVAEEQYYQNPKNKLGTPESDSTRDDRKLVWRLLVEATKECLGKADFYAVSKFDVYSYMTKVRDLCVGVTTEKRKDEFRDRIHGLTYVENENFFKFRKRIRKMIENANNSRVDYDKNTFRRVVKEAAMKVEQPKGVQTKIELRYLNLELQKLDKSHDPMVDIIEKVFNDLEKDQTPGTTPAATTKKTGGGHSEGDTWGEARQCYFETSPTGCTNPNCDFNHTLPNKGVHRLGKGLRGKRQW